LNSNFVQHKNSNRFQANTQSLSSATPANVEILLARLQGVRKMGKGWIARCPSHDDKRPSLAITEGDDGRILMYCRSNQCRPADILASVGLSIADLFPRRLPSKDLSWEERQQLKAYGLQARNKAAANALLSHAEIILIAGRQLTQFKPLDDATYARLATAVNQLTALQGELQNGV